jgi:hypothetical protein
MNNLHCRKSVWLRRGFFGRLCGDQVAGVEAFGEPGVDRGE